MGQTTIEVHPLADKEPRQATLTIRATSVEIQPPKGHPNYQQLSPMTIQVIPAIEQNPPTGSGPVSWLLLTTLPITGLASAVQYLRWYSRSNG